MPLVVCDAGPIIHLHELGSLDLLSDFSSVVVPQSVWHDVQRHRPEALSHAVFAKGPASLAEPLDAELVMLASALALAAGELEALALMKGRKDAIFLTDDAAARLAAEQLGYPVHGTVGILVRSIRRRQRTTNEVISLLASIPQMSTLFIRQSLLQDVIGKLRKHIKESGGRRV